MNNESLVEEMMIKARSLVKAVDAFSVSQCRSPEHVATMEYRARLLDEILNEVTDAFCSAQPDHGGSA
jgi:hypothetical protein